VSFQLSFLGTAGIVLFTDPIRARFPWMPGLLAEPFAVTIAAQLGGTNSRAMSRIGKHGRWRFRSDWLLPRRVSPRAAPQA
jgi:hypothetical protein